MCVPLLLLASVVSLAAGSPQRGSAPIQAGKSDFFCEEDGLYPDFEQCDLYWECTGGVPQSHLCDDGLVFDSLKANAGHVDPCDTPLVVDCTDRPLLQQPTYPSEFCVRRHGIFADPNESVCGRFHTCKDGFKESSTDCSPGLHFDSKQGICTWPDSAGRVGCVENPQSCIKNGNFCCDGRPVFTADGLPVPHPSYVNLDDCQKFYVCLNNLIPQESSCPLGQVFNDKTSLCDYPENVPECRGWFRDHPAFRDYYYDEPVQNTDVGTQDTVV
ncbi:hypothetical protein O3P69_000205 [Scylla paramamosain]|uniref:Chitin-binding type-2 domain-containing protein n=1 Tax=Scylla paramamosain TaxID=85552 RepID=A0AAW0UW97_SCYPA